MARPMIDVASVIVFPRILPCSVYGEISAYDKLDTTLSTYKLYERDAAHAECISEHKRSLSAVDFDKVLLMEHPIISINLKIKLTDAKYDDAFIARGSVDLVHHSDNFGIDHHDYEQAFSLPIKGDMGLIELNYFSLSCALVLNLTLRLSSLQYAIADEITGEHDSELFGEIVARYGKTFGSTEDFRIPLLSVPSDEPIPIFFENGYPTPTIKLTRNYVAVPAYSSLIIEACLTPALSSTPVVDKEDTVTLWPNDWRAAAKVERPVISKRCGEVFKTRLSWIEPFGLEPSSRQTKRKSGVRRRGEILFEVFSVFIGRENNCNLEVSGTITAQSFEDELVNFVIFNRDESNPDKLLDGRKSLTITCPPSPVFCSVSMLLTIIVKLKDSDQRFSIEEGYVDFNTTNFDDPELEFDRPLCSVLRGDGGYCAVHYSMFKSALRVTIKIVLLCKDVDVPNVYGSIVAWSDIFNFTRIYDKRYYRRVLYDKPSGDQICEHKNGEVELSESCVAVPLDFCYNIDFDMYASSPTGSSPSILCTTYKFQLVKGKQREVKLPLGDFDVWVKIY